jgi:hypothetical protein
MCVPERRGSGTGVPRGWWPAWRLVLGVCPSCSSPAAAPPGPPTRTFPIKPSTNGYRHGATHRRRLRRRHGRNPRLREKSDRRERRRHPRPRRDERLRHRHVRPLGDQRDLDGRSRNRSPPPAGQGTIAFPRAPAACPRCGSSALSTRALTSATANRSRTGTATSPADRVARDRGGRRSARRPRQRRAGREREPR